MLTAIVMNIDAEARKANTRGRALWQGLVMLTGVMFLSAYVRGSQTGATAFDQGLKQWSVEQVPGGTVSVREGTLVIEDQDGCTVWLRQKLTAPVQISYDVTVVSKDGPHDRVSDVNCFWMATDPASAGMPAGRSGKFDAYDSLKTYYVGMGGNENTTTRFRRYAGDGSKPLLPGHDLRAAEFLLEPNKTYHLQIIARDGVAEFWRDGKRVFSFQDSAPLTEGWFGIRTVHSHLEVSNFRVTK